VLILFLPIFTLALNNTAYLEKVQLLRNTSAKACRGLGLLEYQERTYINVGSLPVLCTSLTFLLTHRSWLSWLVGS